MTTLHTPSVRVTYQQMCRRTSSINIYYKLYNHPQGTPPKLEAADGGGKGVLFTKQKYNGYYKRQQGHN